MESQIIPIERLPFFKGFHSKGQAIVDVKILESWLTENQGIALLSKEDEQDRKRAYEELEKGESMDLLEVMKKW